MSNKEAIRQVKNWSRKNQWVDDKSLLDQKVVERFVFGIDGVTFPGLYPYLLDLSVAVQRAGDIFNRVPIDGRILPLVLALRRCGFDTEMSCCGHVERNIVRPAEATYPYISIKVSGDSELKCLGELLTRFNETSHTYGPFKLGLFSSDKTKSAFLRFSDHGLTGYINEEMLLAFRQLETRRFAHYLFNN